MRTRSHVRISSDDEESSSNYSSSLASVAGHLATVVTRCQYIHFRIETEHLTSENSQSSSRSAMFQIRAIQQQIDLLSDVKDNLNPEQIEAIRKVLSFAKNSAEDVAKGHLKIHLQISRLGRSIDNSFSRNLSKAITQDDVYSTCKNKLLIELVILQHLLKNGHEDIAVTLVDEAGLDEHRIKIRIQELRQLLRAVRLYDPDPAFQWIQEQDNVYEHTDLLFKLHKIVFRQVALRDGDVPAVEYAQQHFPQFARTYSKDIMAMMCSLTRDERAVPPSYIFTRTDMNLWSEVKNAILRGICTSLKFPPDCYLQTVIDIGCEILPRVIEIQEHMARTNAPPLWYTDGELPVECVNFFHSVFACPILRQECTEENPPLRLECGHVISKFAMRRLLSIRSSTIKCPYCPALSETSALKKLYI